ncbi:MAG: hypothetical protein Q8P13_01395 [bacterium]|nr:hypothetical protein [bacterium]
MVKKLVFLYLIFGVSLLFSLVKPVAAANVNVTSTVPETTITFSGYASASATVTIKESGTTVGTTTANGSSLFSKQITTNPGSHDFTLRQTDTSGRTTPDTSLSGVTASAHLNTAVADIHLAPTIALSKSSINKGETTKILGRGAAGSTIHVFLNGTQKFSGTVASGSDWQFNLSSGYSVGSNTIYAYLTRSGLSDSVNSSTKTLTVTSCKRSDLNCDSHVNLTDFSILLYYWNTSNAAADTNDDGKVGLIDFSIMLFDWTG